MRAATLESSSSRKAAYHVASTWQLDAPLREAGTTAVAAVSAALSQLQLPTGSDAARVELARAQHFAIHHPLTVVARLYTQVLATAPDKGGSAAGDDANSSWSGPLVTATQFASWHAAAEHRLSTQRAGKSKHHAQALQERVDACSQLVDQVRTREEGDFVAVTSPSSDTALCPFPTRCPGGSHTCLLPRVAGPA